MPLTKFTLHTTLQVLVACGLTDANGINHRRFAEMMRRIAKNCKEEWWDTNKNDPVQGNDCFWFPMTDLGNNKTVNFEAVPFDRPNVYLDFRAGQKVADIPNGDNRISFEHPGHTIAAEKMILSGEDDSLKFGYGKNPN